MLICMPLSAEQWLLCLFIEMPIETNENWWSCQYASKRIVLMTKYRPFTTQVVSTANNI